MKWCPRLRLRPLKVTRHQCVRIAYCIALSVIICGMYDVIAFNSHAVFGRTCSNYTTGRQMALTKSYHTFSLRIMHVWNWMPMILSVIIVKDCLCCIKANAFVRVDVYCFSHILCFCRLVYYWIGIIAFFYERIHIYNNHVLDFNIFYDFFIIEVILINFHLIPNNKIVSISYIYI